MEAEDTYQEILQLQKTVNFFRKENALFESYLSTCSEHELSMKGKGKKGKKMKNLEQAQLTFDFKLDISSTVLDNTTKEMDESKKSSEKLLQTLKAVLEETDIRIAELRKDAYEFKRDIVVGAENFRTGKIMAEKVIRYMEEKLRQKDACIEKLKLKNASIKAQISKLEQQLKQKEEMGDVLHYIDFHQLQIENKQNVAKIEQRNQELLKIKMTTGKIVQVLNTKKHELIHFINEVEWLKGEIGMRKRQLEKIEEENRRVARGIERRRAFNTMKQTQQEEATDMPQISDYVQQKAYLYELEAEWKNWKRKVDIRKISARKQRLTMSRQRIRSQRG